MPTYEHTTTYVPVQYRIDRQGFWLFKRDSPLPLQPLADSLWQAPEYESQLSEMGAQGWELVSVQSLLRGVHQIAQGGGGPITASYPVTAGFYFFWKRRKCLLSEQESPANN